MPIKNLHGMGTQCCVCNIRLKQGYQSHMKRHAKQAEATLIAGRWYKIEQTYTAERNQP